MRFDDVSAGVLDWWLVLTDDETDVCDEDPGVGTDVAVCTPLRLLSRVWRGDIGLGGPPARRAGGTWSRDRPASHTVNPQC